ncbi:MAG TPA: competence protein CoiA family protein [Anaeromyxobacteraceae bacterium]|nr:competence protein CoiA family protein [Anaeromyxobacteraceae bacterium]
MPGARGRGTGVQLAWALDRDGRKVSVQDLRPGDRRGRGPFGCPGCRAPLVPHLGPRRARHFAHLPGSACPLTAPETALHLNAKERLLWLAGEAFAGRLHASVLARCPSCRRLAPRDLAAVGDAAVTEGAVGALRADVLVLSRGAPALAVEVRVTHAVEPEKEAALAAAAVPAVEIDAREEWERETPGGAVEIACVRSFGFAPCPACAAQARADLERARGGEAAEVADLEAYRARGLLGALPGEAASAAGRGDVDAPLTPADLAALAARFACPECGGRQLDAGARLAKHACPGKLPRPVAWRGYDGALVELTWWRTPR